MAASHLDIHLSNAEFELDEMYSRKTPKTQTQTQALHVCELHRIAAIANLLPTGNPNRFLEHLRKSGLRYRQFLESGAARLTSCIAPIFDSMACADFETALGCALALGSAWQAGREYEEDHVYAMFVGAVLRGDEAVAAKHLVRFEALSADFADVRCSLCTAYLSTDEPAFDAALERFADAYRKSQQRLMEEDVLSPVEFDTMGRINIEALAWIQLGLRRGFALQSEYLLAPSIARPPARADD